MSIGKKIATLRTAAGLSQRELGRRAGVTGRYIGRIEAGEREGKHDVLASIAEALGTNLADLMSEARQETIPHNGTIKADGTIKGEPLAELLHPGPHRAAREAFAYTERIQVPGAQPGWWVTTAPMDMPRAGILAGDQLAMDPDADAKIGDVVIVTSDTDLFHSLHEDDEISEPQTKIKMLKEIDGERWLWPLAPDDEPVELTSWWRIIAVVAGFWRPMR